MATIEAQKAAERGIRSWCVAVVSGVGGVLLDLAAGRSLSIDQYRRNQFNLHGVGIRRIIEGG
ncbi:hypothetical protein SUH3_18860 [Pseudosulfitobacter pseudonitzschiae]|uniref:Uncharacterized protein n=1 Tax=Pseudosulfitobacter pseudonitzschiae TaxID=1402135 RepID=A0A073JF19_9RHOB|nr:hypothetical protein SUH3_18860 [Pseudosulfitobacter pseudonitzschiae]